MTIDPLVHGEELRDVKLHIPLSHLVRLQSFRVLRRTTMSQLLTEALDHYFETTARPELQALSRMEPHAEHQP